MPLEAAMQSAAAQVGDGVFQAAHDVIEGQQGAAAELDDDGLFGEREHGALGGLGPIETSAVALRLRHFRTVLALIPYWAAKARDDVFDALSSARTRGVVRALP